MKSVRRILILIIPLGLLFAGPGSAFQTSTAPAPGGHSNGKTTAKAPPSQAEITDAKAKGLVWVNTSTHVYHKDGANYGTAKHGKFMSEDDAKKAGYRMAQEPGKSSKASTTKSTASK